MTDGSISAAASSAAASAAASSAAASSAAASSEPVETVETTEVPVNDPRPFLTTGFSDYTVSEGLLLLIFVILLLTFFLSLIRRWF
jgi:hypothetical protein